MRGFAGFLILLALALAGCHGSTQDAYYPGSLGHEQPPAINLPPQDAGMSQR